MSAPLSANAALCALDFLCTQQCLAAPEGDGLVLFRNVWHSLADQIMGWPAMDVQLTVGVSGRFMQSTTCAIIRGCGWVKGGTSCSICIKQAWIGIPLFMNGRSCCCICSALLQVCIPNAMQQALSTLQVGRAPFLLELQDAIL
mgnify:FL=1